MVICSHLKNDGKRRNKMINNSVHLIGRLTKDPKLNKTESGLSVVNFLIVSDRFQKDADFIPIQAWRQSADYLCQLSCLDTCLL